MSNFAEKLRLKERAEEDMYFAKRDRELIAALRGRRSGKSAGQLAALRVSGGQVGGCGPFSGSKQ